MSYMPLFFVVFNKTITAEVDNTNADLTHSTSLESEKRHHKAQFFFLLLAEFDIVFCSSLENDPTRMLT